MSQENVDNLRAFLETWDRDGNIRAFVDAVNRGEADMSVLDPKVTYEDTSLPDHVGETYRGHEGVIRATERWIEYYEWLLIELEQIVDAGDRLVSVQRVRAKARRTGIEFDGLLAYLWTFRDGKIVHFRSFRDPEQAMEAAGLRG
jgi:ketosteroid isomerase-like protein